MQEIIALIKEVTAYSDRALIIRQGSIHLEPGEHNLRINNLPQFLRDSLRAAGKGPQGTRILNVDLTTAYYSNPPEAEIQRLQSELENLQQQAQLLEARQTSLHDRQKWLRALGEQSHDFAKGLAQGNMKPDDCGNFFHFMATQTLQDAQAAQELAFQQSQVQKEVYAKQRELQQHFGTNNPDRLAVNVTVEMQEEGDFELEISYLTTNASWYPQYDVRVQIGEQTAQGTVELTYIGMVSQSTGEAWNNVQLALSTARPSQAAILPELQPWYLKTPVPPIPPQASVMHAASAPAPLRAKSMLDNASTISLGAQDRRFGAQMDREVSIPEPIVAEIATANVEQTGTALIFRVGHTVDIPSDNSPHKTTIALNNFPCEFDYVSAPTLEENAHLRATVTNTAEQVLLKGNASIFLSGEYVGTTLLKHTAPSETFKIFLGIDDSIKVKRELTERNVEKGNILQNDLRRNTYAYRITIHNYAPVQRKIVVHDHLPVSQHERIKVKIQTLQPQPTEHTKLELLTWEFPLASDGEQKIDYRFSVEYPQGQKIIGLP